MSVLPDYGGSEPEPPRKIRPIVGPVNPMPCSNDNCPGLTVLGGDDDPDLMRVLELYRGHVVRVTIELVSGCALPGDLPLAGAVDAVREKVWSEVGDCQGVGDE